MGLFNVFKKNGGSEQTEEPVKTADTVEANEENAAASGGEPQKSEPQKNEKDSAKSPVGLDLKNKEQVDARLKEIHDSDRLYIILSASIADLEKGYSIPLVLMPQENVRVMLIFTDYEAAKYYVEVKRPMVIEGVYPIGEIRKDDKLNNIDVICANALALGVTAIDFDVATDKAFGCRLPYFMQVNNMSGQGQVLLSKQEVENVKKNGGKFKPRFNGIKIMNFSNEHLLTKDRAAEVEEKILGEDGIEWARENAKLNELCYTANNLTVKAAEKDKQEEGSGKELRDLIAKLNEIIFDRLSELKKWYTIVNKETGEIYTKNGAAYLLYTGRYFNRMPEGTQQKAIGSSVAEFAYEVGDKDVKYVVVTDGPRIMHIMDRSEFGF